LCKPSEEISARWGKC